MLYTLYTNLQGPRSLTNIAAVVLPSFYILQISLMMVTKQWLKHVADFLNSKAAFWLKTCILNSHTICIMQQ